MKLSSLLKNKEGVHIFKIKDEPLKRPFVSEEFKKTVEKNGLTGFRFELAWSDEQDYGKVNIFNSGG